MDQDGTKGHINQKRRNEKAGDSASSSPLSADERPPRGGTGLANNNEGKTTQGKTFKGNISTRGERARRGAEEACTSKEEKASVAKRHVG